MFEVGVGIENAAVKTSDVFDWGTWNQVEHSPNLNTLYFTHRIKFPQRERLTQLTAT